MPRCCELRFGFLTGQHERGGAVPARNRGVPRDCGLGRVARAPHRQIRRGAQIRKLFDRLVRWTVFAESNGIMRVYEDVVRTHQRREADGIARVFHEDQERAGIRNEPAMQRDAVGDGRHRKLAHTEVHIVAGVLTRDRFGIFPIRVVRPRQVGRTADQFRQHRTQRIQTALRRFARFKVFRLCLSRSGHLVERLTPIGWQLTPHAPVEFGREIRERGAIRIEQRIPLRLALAPNRTTIPFAIDRFGYLERARNSSSTCAAPD